MVHSSHSIYARMAVDFNFKSGSLGSVLGRDIKTVRLLLQLRVALLNPTQPCQKDHQN